MKKTTPKKVTIQTTSKSNHYQSGQGNQQSKNGQFSPGALLSSRKQRKYTVKQTMKENSYLSSRKQVKHTRSEYREAQRNFRSKVEKHEQLKRSLESTEQKRTTAKSAQEIRAQTFAKAKLKSETDKAEGERNAAKENLKVKREVYKKTKKADTTRFTKQATRQVGSAVKRKGEETFGSEGTLAEAMKIRQDSRRRTNTYQTSKYLLNNAHRMNMKLAKGTYGLSNKSYNYIRGRGFQRTPEQYSKMQQTAKKFRNFQNRLKASKLGKAAKSTSNFMSSVLRVLNNPLKVRNLAILGGLALVIATIFMFIPLTTPLPIQQDDFQLTESWLHMTKVDADRSDDTYSFYTPFDEVMFYMNYNFEDYTTAEYMTILGNKRYGDYMNGIWEAMNDTSKDEYKFTSMYDLAKDKKSKYHMDKDDFEEMKENAEEYGYSTLDGQLEFPYKTENLPITRRFGFEVNSSGKAEKFSSIEVESSQDQDIQAPMGGTVEWHEDQSKVVIKENESNGSRVILTGINAKRHETGMIIKEGELIGKATGSTLTISYEKYSEDKKKMLRVNPAFYFEKVTYRQKTTITEPFDPEGGELENARFLYSKLTEMGYKLEGIAAMLGNFSVESGINPKRAEGDYLNPPVGASKNSWDDPAWLNIGGMQIYGRYPNIIHRGLGLGQWTDTADGGTRHTLLVNFAKEKKKKWYSLGLQLDFMMNGDVPAYRTIFKSAMDGSAGNGVAELTRYFLGRWEGNPGDKLAARIEAAEKWYAYFKANPDKDPGGSTGKYILPLSPPNISSWFGWRSMGDYHRGIDFAHPQGTPIKAIDGGTVITAEFHYSWGNHVRVKHDNGQTSLYAHCVSLNVKVGDKLKQGDIVGLVGNTGNSFGAHLHLGTTRFWISV
ncbi:phage tail tip lysozyme [Enterococcus sp. DIV0187]|uniref:phage tail tip lysozyme n=1 Tax=Enterococcus sp. DIV0187 TaxID=2774644 RepID=UPI003F28386B